MDWEALQAGENGVTIEVDSNSDGAVDQSIITGSELNDTIAPATTATLDGTEIPGFGYLPGAIVILAAADNEGGSGATTTEYSLGNGTSWLPYTTPLVFNAEGEVTLIYRSRDALGNQEESQTLEIRIVSARSLREALLPILDSLVTGKPAIDLKTKQMAKSIAASLTASYWQDRNHVVPPGGAAILIADSLAIGIAKTALGQSINPLPPVAAEAYRQSIASLLASDRILASLRLAEAKTHPVTGVLKQKLAQNYLQQAEAAFAKAEGESVAEPVRTVADYYSAWLLSGMVLKL